MTTECESECVPFVPTPDEEVRRGFRYVNLKPNEVFVELGCGDGKNLRIATSEFGAIGIGYELNPERAKLARERNKGFPVTIKEESFMHGADDITKADVVFVYLLQSVNQYIKPMLEAFLNPSARVISRHYTFDGWIPSTSEGNVHVYLSHPTVKETEKAKLMVALGLIAGACELEEESIKRESCWSLIEPYEKEKTGEGAIKEYVSRYGDEKLNRSFDALKKILTEMRTP